MPTVITREEYLEFNGVPLATPGWEITDLSGLWDAPAVRGEDRLVPYHEGVLPLRRWIDMKRAQLPLIVYGDLDHEDAPHVDARAGLLENLDYLKQRVLRPNQSATITGTRNLKHHLPDGSVREADAIILPPWQPVTVGPHTLRGVLDVLIPGGVMRSGTATNVTSASIPAGTPTAFTVPNPGTADQYDVVIELTGSATQVTLEATTWDPNGDTYLEFNGSLGTLTTIDTGEFTAVRDGVGVIGLIDHSGHERWLPLVPGDNTITITAVGGNVVAEFTHFAPYL